MAHTVTPVFLNRLIRGANAKNYDPILDTSSLRDTNLGLNCLCTQVLYLLMNTSIEITGIEFGAMLIICKK
jgi:hypothetical protein